MGFGPAWRVDGVTLYPAARQQFMSSDEANTVKTDGTGIGFFNVAPVAQQAKPANPAADPASLQTATQALIDALGAYGLIA